MKVVEFYILRRAVAIFAATLVWVLAIVWTTQILARLNIVTTSGQSAATFLELAALVLPSVVPIVLPFAVGIAVAQTLTTMNTDSELIVISAAGSPRITVMRPMLLLAIFACLASFAIQNGIVPSARERIRYLVAEARADLISTIIQEGSFQKIDDGLHIQIGERLPGGMLGGIFVADAREDSVELIYYAKNGMMVELGEEQVLVMQDGVVHRKTADGVSVIRYKSYAFDLSQFKTGSAEPTLSPKDRPLAYLFSPDPNDSYFQSRPLSFSAELHRRMTEWLYPMVFALIGLAVAGDSRSFRESRIHPLLTTMTIAMAIRWGGFYFENRISKDPSLTFGIYAVPLLASAVAIYFIVTNRVMELPTTVTERIANLWSRWQRRLLTRRLATADGGTPPSGGRS
ncbi:LptF/LptG family permease [Aquamicrobium zhengzhouense]|uniref:LptF/LptG family permease n=1 Tax=Aquamicrobium zhengzhouense TaxID=2781738 RepID=A0ABS0SBY1_9HYPH|nr:LptF/LptG family permease [Aquamicrobium zhengzhouense]MBI1620274.1 LptF/LptG family permease [Aquamicrobium zhengzhouense]